MHRRPGSMLARASAFAALVAATGVTPAAGQGIPVTVGVGGIATGAGQFDLPVMLDMSARTEKLGSFVVTVQWDPAVVKYVGGVDGNFGTVVVDTTSLAAGIAKMAGVNPAGAAGLLTLAVGRFQVLANDTTTFRVSVQELYAAGSFADLTADAVVLDQLFCGSITGRYGDLNGDGSVNGADALIVLTESVGLDVSQYALAFGDVDSNGVRNPRDALLILSFAVGIPTDAFRVGQVVAGNVCTPPAGQGYGINPAVAQALVGQTIDYYAFGVDANGAALALRNVTFASSNSAVATVDATGTATAAGPGTTTITALQNDTTIASSSLTVVAARPLHWVDALANRARNQLGTAALPFGTLAKAVAVAATGDTVRVRSGRYAGAVIPRSLTIVGDTSAGGTRPVFVPANLATIQDTALTILTTAVRVELRDLQVDTATYGIVAVGVDTLVMRGVSVRGAAGGMAAVSVDTAKAVRLTNVGLFGVPNVNGPGTNGLWSNVVGTIAVDSSIASDFAGSGIAATQSDSIDVRNSVLRYNGVSGLQISTQDTASAAKLVFSRNLVTQNAYYGVYGYYVRRAIFDHNRFVGGGYYGDGIQLNGNRSALLSVRGDTLDVRTSRWLYASVFDSVSVDSVVTTSTDYGAQIYDVRRVLIKDSDLSAGYYEAFYVYGRGPDTTTVLVRNASFSGFTNLGYYDGYGVSTAQALLDVRDSRFSDLYYGLEASYGVLDVSHSTFDRSYYAVYGSCLQGASRVDSTRIRGTYYGVYVGGCGTGQPSIVLDSLDVSNSTYAAYLDNLSKGRIRRSAVGSTSYGVTFYAVDSATVDTSALAGTYALVAATYDTVTTLNGNALTCTNNDGVQLYYGGRAFLRGNLITGKCVRAIYAFGNDSLVVRGNVITASGDVGIYGYAYTAQSDVHVVGNTVTGPFGSGSISVSASNGLASFLRVDSNTVSAGAEAGIYSPQGDSVMIRGNTVTDVKSGTCCLSYDGGIVIGPSASARKWVRVLRNKIVGATFGIRIDRSSTDTVPAVVDTNRVLGSDSVGIYVTDYSRIRARYNAVDSTTRDGIRVDRVVAGDTNVQFMNNNITRSGRYGLLSLDAGTITGTQNWWGDPAGPGGTFGVQGSPGDSVSSGVDWSNFLTSPVTVPPAPPAALVAGMTRMPMPSAGVVSLPAVREPRAPPDLPGASAPPAGRVVPGWTAGVDAQRARQEARIQRYRAEVERRAAIEAARERGRKEGGR